MTERTAAEFPEWIQRVLRVTAPAYVTVPGRNGFYKTRVEDVALPLLAIGIPLEQGKPIFVRVGETVSIMVVGPRYPVRMKARIVRMTSKPIPMWIVEVPPAEEIEVVHRRRAVRVPVRLNLAVQKRPPEEEGAPSEARAARRRRKEDAFGDDAPVLKGQAVDLSITGVRMAVFGHLDVGDRVRIEIEFPWGIEVLYGRVARVIPSETTSTPVPSSRPLYQYGVEFEPLDIQLEQEIQRYLIQRQQELRLRGAF